MSEESKDKGNISQTQTGLETRAFYLRVSSDRGVGSCTTVSDQQEQLTRFCQEKGWVVEVHSGFAAQVASVFDEWRSNHIGTDSMRARRRKVLDGYWPGGRPPYGYKLSPASDNPRRSVLTIAEDESRLVERIFSLARIGDGKSAPLGIKEIAKWLNEHGLRTRNQSPWGAKQILRILTGSIYHGLFYWGRRATERKNGAVGDRLTLHAPPIVTREEFDAVQEALKHRP
ncbi:hypothetical protein HGP14_30735 [Rhizobium sp. P32RR-XVIII]|uniref:recombinase family protein n=1 Tax=Rhizobium sp. P32RR-XVIII TaxID=2726738 RepID=UPI0014573B59|nr:recombinase family protein [Rhizobium sp. P32RR-XVIII]NLS07640.1 hypothetical protein [Rhizobium sp. P32RR-XVIII]